MRNAIFDGFALARQLSVEVGDFVDGVDVEQFFEPRHKTWQVVAVQLRQQFFIFKGRLKTGIHFGRFKLECFLEGNHGFNDPLGQPLELLVFCVNARLQPCTHVLLTVVAGFHCQLMLAQRRSAHGFEFCRQSIIDDRALQQRLGLQAKILRVGAALFYLGALLAPSLQLFTSFLLHLLHCAQAFIQLLQDVRR